MTDNVESTGKETVEWRDVAEGYWQATIGCVSIEIEPWLGTTESFFWEVFSDLPGPDDEAIRINGISLNLVRAKMRTIEIAQWVQDIINSADGRSI